MVNVEKILIENITIPEGRRALNPITVAGLADSMGRLGLMVPVTIRSNSDDMAILIAGHHRLAAAKRLGWTAIDCIVRDCTADEAEMWEISENLHRAELTVLERSEQMARWVELADKVAQLAPPGGVQPNDTGIRKATRDLGVERTSIQRAMRVAALTPEAKEAARQRGLDDNQTAMIAAAAVSPERQAEAIHHYADMKERAAAERANVPRVVDWTDIEATQKKRLMAAWNDASPAVKEWFLIEIDTPVMDRAAS